MTLKTADDLLKEGYHLWDGKPAIAFEDITGPMLMKEQKDGLWQSALVVEDKHMNIHGSMHGGMLMSFADFSLFVFAHNCFRDEFFGVTVSINCDFLSAAKVGDLVEGKGGVTRETGSMIFARGGLYVGDDCLLSFSGVIKKIRKR